MRKIILTFAVVLVSQLGFTQIDEAFKKDALEVIEKSGAANQMKAAKDQILGMIPEAKKAAFIVEFDATLPALYDKLAGVYMEVYTKEDLKGILKFYETPAGKKMASTAGLLMEKSQAAGQEWGQGIQGIMAKYME